MEENGEMKGPSLSSSSEPSQREDLAGTLAPQKTAQEIAKLSGKISEKSSG